MKNLKERIEKLAEISESQSVICGKLVAYQLRFIADLIEDKEEPELQITTARTGRAGRKFTPEQRKLVSDRMREWHRRNKFTPVDPTSQAN